MRGAGTEIFINNTFNQLGISFNRAVFTLLKNALLLGFLFEIFASFQILGN